MVVNRKALYELLGPFGAHIVTGHVHENEHHYEVRPHERGGRHGLRGMADRFPLL